MALAPGTKLGPYEVLALWVFHGKAMRIRFGECQLDSTTRELIARGKAVPLAPKGFQLLELLLTNRPRALSKAEILERVWPGTFVSEGSLTSRDEAGLSERCTDSVTRSPAQPKSYAKDRPARTRDASSSLAA